MKRYLLITGALLLCLTIRAQSVTYTCRYWFDQQFGQAVTTTFSDATWQADLDVGSLTEGLHALHLHVMDTSMKWNAPQSYLFLKLTPPASSSDFTYYYWFDQDLASMQSGALGDGHLLLDVDDLSEGLHTIHVMLKGGEYSASQTYLFFKADAWESGTPNYVYHCWFDEDFANQQTDALGSGHLLLDVTNLEDGMHSVHVLVEGSSLTATQSYIFMKMAVEDPSTELQYTCWFDQDYSNAQTGPLGSGLFELEVGDLPNGIHTVNVQLSNGMRTAPQCYLFYKQPLGGYGIARWEYWLNDDVANRQITNISPTVDTLDIISLLNVSHPALRSSCFHFHPNGDAPYINAKNQINFRFYDSELHLIDRSAFYVDEQVQQDIVATVFERNTTETFTTPRDNQITWFKLEANRGDYTSLQADKACTMQLFAPSGEEVYAASGPESILLEGFNVWEDGTYYLAVHDVTGSGETVSVTYNWLNRYAVLSYDVHLVGNGGCSTITFQGNGFNSLLDAYFVNWQNDTIRSLDIGHESNTTTTVSLNFYQENLGTYDAVFEFYEETIRINGALEVQEPVDILLTSTVSYPSTFLRNTPCTYTYTITNNGNMSAYAVPVYLYVSSQTKDGISHLEIDGLDLPSVIDGIDLDSLSPNDRIWLQEWADEIGEDHYFLKMHVIDENTEDSIYVRSNFFFVTLAPFETKTIAIKVTADEPINVFVTIPNDTILPLVLSPEGDYRGGNRGWYCCMQEQIQCTLNLICSSISIASIVPAWAAPLAVADCICGIINEINDVYSSVFCDGNSNLSYWERFKNMKKAVSVTGTVVACIKKNNPIGKIIEILDAIDAVVNGLTLGDITHDVSDCIEKWKKVNPSCNPGSPDGGGSTPVNSLDPNDIRGYLSESGSHYMRQEIQSVQYEIEFENDTTLATTAAHTIIVRDTLDASKFDLNSLAARSVTIGNKRLELNGEQTFARTLDMRPELYVIAQIEQDYDPTTGIVEWTIQSLDPMTMEPTDNPYQGVLPVNYSGNGVGFIDYSINLKQAFADGTAITNRAGIIFDQEEVIMTPTWTNIIDAVKPTSHIESVAFEADTLNFGFVSSDSRSGVWYHSLYYRNEATEQEWKVKVPKILENNCLLHFDEYQTTEYLVMAVDSAGNVEDKDMVAEYVHYYGPEPICQTVTLDEGWNWFSTYLDITLGDLKTALVEAAPCTAISIKSQTQNTSYNPNTHRWSGSVAWNVANMYMIKVAGTCEIELVGVPINPALHTIPISSGSNWLAFPLNANMSLSNAFAGFATNGDRVKSQTNNALYNGIRWQGQLNTLEPGKGYIYISNSSGERIFTFPTSAK